MTTETSIDVMAQFGILEPHEVAELLKLRHSTVLDLSRRGSTAGVQDRQALALPPSGPRGVDGSPAGRPIATLVRLRERRRHDRAGARPRPDSAGLPAVATRY